MSLYKQRNGYTGDFGRPPTCDSCGVIISTHRSRWHTLWNKPVLICTPCRSLVRRDVLIKKIAHVRMLLELEREYNIALCVSVASPVSAATVPVEASVSADLHGDERRKMYEGTFVK